MKNFLVFLCKGQCGDADIGDPAQRLGLLEGRMGGGDGGCSTGIDAETPAELCILFSFFSLFIY